MEPTSSCEDNSSSSANPDEESRSTMVRRVLPKEEEEGNSPPLHTVLPIRSNKRRCVSSACIPCRKRKSKVSGEFNQAGECLYTSTLAVVRKSCNFFWSVDSVMVPPQLAPRARPSMEPNVRTTSMVITVARER